MTIVDKIKSELPFEVISVLKADRQIGFKGVYHLVNLENIEEAIGHVELEELVEIVNSQQGSLIKVQIQAIENIENIVIAQVGASFMGESPPPFEAQGPFRTMRPSREQTKELHAICCSLITSEMDDVYMVMLGAAIFLKETRNYLDDHLKDDTDAQTHFLKEFDNSPSKIMKLFLKNISTAKQKSQSILEPISEHHRIKNIVNKVKKKYPVDIYVFDRNQFPIAKSPHLLKKLNETDEVMVGALITNAARQLSKVIRYYARDQITEEQSYNTTKLMVQGLDDVVRIHVALCRNGDLCVAVISDTESVKLGILALVSKTIVDQLNNLS